MVFLKGLQFKIHAVLWSYYGMRWRSWTDTSSICFKCVMFWKENFLHFHAVFLGKSSLHPLHFSLNCLIWKILDPLLPRVLFWLIHALKLKKVSTWDRDTTLHTNRVTLFQNKLSVRYFKTKFKSKIERIREMCPPSVCESEPVTKPCHDQWLWDGVVLNPKYSLLVGPKSTWTTQVVCQY